MAIQFDNIHWDTRDVDGYDLPFNFIISEREIGKSTIVIFKKLYLKFRNTGATSIVVRRNVNDISESYIEDFSKIINKFSDDGVTFQYNKSSIKDGIVDIKVDGKDFIRFIGLSKKIASMKSMMYPKLETILFDEFICNARFGEKYLKEEAIKFMELYNTFRRESKKLKCWFLGNPYSVYNPYFVYFNVDTSNLKRGCILSDKKTYVIQCAEMKPELRAKILAENPLYQFDNSYTRYAFGGVNVNDENIQVVKQRPEGFALKFLFRIESKYIAIYRNNDYTNTEGILYYATFIDVDSVSRKRDIYCFDFTELVDRTSLLSIDDRWRFSKLKGAMRERQIVFSSIECYYLCEEIFFNI